MQEEEEEKNNISYQRNRRKKYFKFYLQFLFFSVFTPNNGIIRMMNVIQKCDDHSLYSLKMAGTKTAPGPHEVAINMAMFMLKSSWWSIEMFFRLFYLLSSFDCFHFTITTPLNCTINIHTRTHASRRMRVCEKGREKRKGQKGFNLLD